MNSFMSWVGGKKALRDAVLARFPPYYERYIEVFGGAGWVLFHKPSDNDFEIFNDFNSNLINLYRCVRDKPNKLKYKLQYVLNSREDFNWIVSLHKRGLFPKFCGELLQGCGIYKGRSYSAEGYITTDFRKIFSFLQRLPGNQGTLEQTGHCHRGNQQTEQSGAAI